VPLLIHPRTGYTGLVKLNDPGPESIVLVTGNNEYTEEVVLAVLGTTTCPFFVLFADTDGNTVDMAMIYKTFNAERIARSFTSNGMREKSTMTHVIIPGLAAELKDEIEKYTGIRVRVGPKCAAELPLFLSGIWIPPSRG
jgi:CO dehydrogenase/acetyl-CoA synthase gamma subunit (corrinoid Fe-S protein)